MLYEMWCGIRRQSNHPEVAEELVHQVGPRQSNHNGFTGTPLLCMLVVKEAAQHDEEVKEHSRDCKQAVYYPDSQILAPIMSVVFSPTHL